MIFWLKRIYKEWDCVMMHGKHVYNDGPWNPTYKCFWCGKLKPGKGKS